MALNDAATLVIGSGNYFTAPVDTECPDATGRLAPPEPWEKIGHTSLSEILSATSEGGEATVLGTLQSKNLRTSYSNRSESFAIKLQQFDEPSLKLYYGSNASVDALTGLMMVPDDPKPTTCAFLTVFVDGDNHFAFYAPKCEIYRGDDVDLSDTESLASLPLVIKPMNSGANTWAYAVTPLAAVAP